jgi:redox-sensitive bicupin YhaK (pirin superfamily)
MCGNGLGTDLHGVIVAPTALVPESRVDVRPEAQTSTTRRAAMNRRLGASAAKRHHRPVERPDVLDSRRLRIEPVPAITVPDITVLPRIPEPYPTVARMRPVRSLTTAPHGLEGEGFPVRRAFAGVDLADLDPFVHLDQMGEVEYAPGEPKGTPWHPHRGFETVTYMIDGTFEHSDSNGGGGVITNGDTQWMTAGAGILHIEKPPESLVVSGGLFHGFQLWVNLPRAQKWAPPRYQDLRAREVAVASSPDGGALVRIIAGEVAGHKGPGSTYTPMTLVHATLSPGARLSLAWRADYNALVYAMAGRGTVGAEGRPIGTGQLAVFGRGNALTLAALQIQESRSPNLDVLILGGRPIGEPVAWMGPFVMNTRQEVIQAFADYQAGRLGTIPATTTVHNTPTTVVESNRHEGDEPA